MEYPRDRTLRWRTESEDHRLALALRAPAAPLRSWVRGYCLYDEGRARPGRHDHLPHRDVTLIINAGGAFAVRDPGGGRQRFAVGEGFLAGLHAAPARTDSGPRQRGVEVKLTPLGAHRLLGGLPMQEVSNRVLGLDALLGAAGRELGARLAGTRGSEEPFALLDDFFAPRILDGPAEVGGELRQAWRWLDESHGRVRVGEIAARLGWSRKRLVAEFRRCIGMTPKTLARVLRFDRTMQALRSGRGVRWSELALAGGYHDQAHLSREIRELAGATPAEIARRSLPESGGVVSA